FNILLQVLDDGRLTDNNGRTVDFRNTIIIMTSNIGSHIIMDNFSTEAGKEAKITPELIDKTKREVFELMKQTIRPEFLNRIDEIVMFTPLNKEDILRIVKMQICGIRKLLETNNVTLDVTKKAEEWLAQEGYDPMFGARPVKRTLQRYVVNELSKEILSGKINREKPISIDAGAEGLTFRN
ncbi:MAG: AAA family ATPase, partial [Rikenellaceae bacterium]|nr:AAA family ATPase [Rikenellaceae bacterium]